jgi:DNA invertase Pin-like site-specific DNA recombinase
MRARATKRVVTPSKPLAAAIYARVSTDDQNCENQLAELRAYAARMGWGVAEEYIDHAQSGAKRSRPALNSLMADARLRKFDVVAVWKMDRFGRSLQHLIENITALDHAGIRFVAPTQGIDTDVRSPSGRLLMHIMGAFAEFERDLIRERTLAGLAVARARGKKLGRPCKVFRRDRALELRAKGWSWRKISRELKVAQSTIRLVLSRVQKTPRAGSR